MNIEEMAMDYLNTIMPSDHNIDVSQYEIEYNAFIAGANAVKNYNVNHEVKQTIQLITSELRNAFNDGYSLGVRTGRRQAENGMDDKNVELINKINLEWK